MSACRQLARPAAVVVLAFCFGAALLGLAGWFIASSAVAGLAVASTFSFLYPSAGVQALAWVRTLARYGERITTHEATLDLVGSLRTGLFAGALKLPRDRAAALRSSELLGQITVDSDAVENLLLRSRFPMLAAAAGLAITAAFFALLSPTLAAVASAGMLLSAAALIALVHNRSGRPARELVTARAEARRTLIETLDGLPELRSFGAVPRARLDILRHLEHLDHSRRRLKRLESRGQSIGTLVCDLTLVAIAATATGLLGTGTLGPASFVAATLIAIAAFEPVTALPGAVTARAKARAAARRLNETFLDRPLGPARPLPSAPWPLELRVRASGIHLALEPGDTILLTGPSGVGKSTLLRAIAGRSAAGIQARLGGVDTDKIDPEALAQHIMLLAQDQHVFDGTIRDNLALANPAATEAELWRALAAAALADTVTGFPAGLDTPVGPGGSELSGGQRRRLSVAQALLRHPAVLLLDEPTEGLDTATGSRLLAGVRGCDPHAVIVIALHDRQSPIAPWVPSARIHLREPHHSALRG
ncbi:MAG TPA: ATP-binding cassette domain-containing protein [Solirubrobacteraceae bacterium]|nr:ATP-binding cassette domain-containing protein [Solirubrobacteraceae bacterium]